MVGDGVEFEVWSERPLLYLDHWALRRLSENSALGDRFLLAFQRRGTVMFSLMNVVEIARDASESRASQIRDFLGKLGPHWMPMTIDPLRIIEAEETGRTPDGVHPCVSAGFLRDPKFAARLTEGPVSLVHVVDLTRGPDGDELRHDTDRDTSRLRRHIQDWRIAHATDPREVDAKFPRLQFDSNRPMRGIYHGLARYTIIDTFTFDDNHARDMFHAMASVRCADMVTLDAHWSGQVGKLRLPTDFVRVYTEGELDAFLADLEAAPATR